MFKNDSVGLKGIFSIEQVHWNKSKLEQKYKIYVIYDAIFFHTLVFFPLFLVFFLPYSLATNE